MGLGHSKKVKSNPRPSSQEFNVLASQTSFTVNEVESLYDLYEKLSSTVVKDGFIQKEELQLALLRNINKRSLFLDRMFDLFDVNGNGHIDFEEFVQTLSVFHPKTPEADKAIYNNVFHHWIKTGTLLILRSHFSATVAFKLYDLRHTGYIEREELKAMVLAILNESDLVLSEDVVETILNQTFAEADTKGDGRIDEEEWKGYAERNPSLLKNMTLPYLMDIALTFPPSFMVNTESEERK